MPRAATPEEMAVHVLPATPAIAAAVREWLAARDDPAWDVAAGTRRRVAWMALEDLLTATAQTWWVVDGWAWRAKKISRCGLEVVSRPVNQQKGTGA